MAGVCCNRLRNDDIRVMMIAKASIEVDIEGQSSQATIDSDDPVIKSVCG